MKVCKKIPDWVKELGGSWANQPTTPGETEIIEYLHILKLKKMNILHVGVGNSQLAESLDRSNKIVGISVHQEEIDKANEKDLKNYKARVENKHALKIKPNSFNLIIDNNLKSYSCHEHCYHNYLRTINKALLPGGALITNQRGLEYTCVGHGPGSVEEVVRINDNFSHENHKNVIVFIKHEIN